jgi:hypothetical protein
VPRVRSSRCGGQSFPVAKKSRVTLRTTELSKTSAMRFGTAIGAFGVSATSHIGERWGREARSLFPAPVIAFFTLFSIARANKLVVRLVPVTPPKVQRRLGEAKGLVSMALDFDDLPQDLMEHFR